MNSDPAEELQANDQQPPPDSGKLPVSEHAAPVEVPVFSCLVYVATESDGTVKARVANLAGLSFTANSERAALGKIIPAFKQQIVELMQNQTPIPWIDPPEPAEPGEQTRYIPVHL